MRVNSEQIPEKAIHAATYFMQQREWFIAGQIREVLAENKVRQVYSTAERLIQKYKKSGLIIFNNKDRSWYWVRKAEV